MLQKLLKCVSCKSAAKCNIPWAYTFLYIMGNNQLYSLISDNSHTLFDF